MVMVNGERASRGRSLARPAHERTICEIRALDTIAELNESYRLRYEVYGALGYIQRSNKAQLEIDEYDSFSIPFGAFAPDSGKMIGTIRLITTELQPDYDASIRRVVAEHDDAALTEQALGPWPYPLPSMITDETQRQIEAFNTERLVVAELSRTIVHPGYRGSGISRGLMEFGLAHAARFAPAILIGGCLPEHLPMYARYGYRKLPQTGLDRHERVGQLANTVVCRTDVLPQPTRTHIDEMLYAMRSGASECTLEIGRDTRALYRFAPTRRPRRRTMQW